jgi:hypothetical protein
MSRELVRDGLLFALAQRYKEDPSHFLYLSKQSMGSSLTLEIVAELRNAGHIEEEHDPVYSLWIQIVQRRTTFLRFQKLSGRSAKGVPTARSLARARTAIVPVVEVSPCSV